MAGGRAVSVILVNYRTERFLAACLDSVRNQDYPDAEIILVNNASPYFNAGDWEGYGIAKIIENSANIGFARANNQGMAASRCDYILLLNCDAYLAPGAISEAVSVMESSPDVAQVALKVLSALRTDEIDSAGHLFRPDRTAAHRGRGENDAGQFDEETDMFGGSACACLYRRDALEEVSCGGEYFDGDFGSYYEDVDLDWRLRLAGYRCRFAPRAAAFHHGQGSNLRAGRAMQIEAEKNRYLMMAKCDTPADRAGHRFHIAAYEIWHALQLVARPRRIAGIFKYLRLRGRAMQKRARVQSLRKESRVVYTSRFKLTDGALGKPPPQLSDFYLALHQPPVRTPPPGFKPFLDSADRAHLYVNSDWSGKKLRRVSVIVLNVNGAEMTRECLSALALQDYPDFEVVAVDNGSARDELAEIERGFPRTKGIRLPENAGFAGGINRALPFCDGQLVALINNDCEPEPGWISALVRRMDETGAAAVSGTMREEELMGASPFHALSLLGRVVPGAYGEKPLSFYPSGGNCLIDMEKTARLADEYPWTLGRTGGALLPDFYLLYSEDVSLGWRLRLAGLGVAKAADAKAAHRVSATAARFPAGLLRYLRNRNRLLNILLFMETRTLAKVLPLLALEWIGGHIAGLFYWQLGEPLLSVDWFFVTNMRAVVRQRLAVQSARLSPDAEILPLLSCRLTPGFPGLARAMMTYCAATGLKTVERK